MFLITCHIPCLYLLHMVYNCFYSPKSLAVYCTQYHEMNSLLKLLQVLIENHFRGYFYQRHRDVESSIRGNFVDDGRIMVF